MMNRLIVAIGIALVGACDPLAQELCEKQQQACAPIGADTDVEACLDTLHMEEGSADERGCLAEYQSLVACQIELDGECDTARREVGIAVGCGSQLCEYNGCRERGGEHWHAQPSNPCVDGHFDPVGDWSLSIFTSGCASPETLSIRVEASGDTYRMTALDYTLTGTITPMAATVAMNVVAEPMRSELPRYALELFTFGTHTATQVTGTGTATQLCSPTALVGGQLVR